MDQWEQEQRPVRREYGSSTAADSIGQARRVIDQLEARINDARRVPMSKTLSIVDAGELIDLIGQLRIVLPHTVVQAQAILEQQKQILGEAKAEADRTADKADEIYTTTVEKAKQFEQEVKADADAYDKQIRLVFSTGVVVFIVSLIMLIYALVAKLAGHTSVGWTSLMGSIWLIGGIQLLGLGVVGEYIGKIYNETKRRPRFIIESVLNKADNE